MEEVPHRNKRKLPQETSDDVPWKKLKSIESINESLEDRMSDEEFEEKLSSCVTYSALPQKSKLEFQHE